MRCSPKAFAWSDFTCLDRRAGARTLLTRNGVIKESDALDASTPPKVKMANHDGFVPAKPMHPEPAQYSGDCGSLAWANGGRCMAKG